VSHELCAEAAVVGFDHSVKGQVRLQSCIGFGCCGLLNEPTAFKKQGGQCCDRCPAKTLHRRHFQQSLGSSVARSDTLQVKLLQSTLCHAESQRQSLSCR